MWGQLTQKHRQLSNQVQHKMLRIMELVCRCCCRLVTGAGGEVINNRPPTAPLGRSPSVRAAPHRFRPLHARQLPKPARADLAHLSLWPLRRSNGCPCCPCCRPPRWRRSAGPSSVVALALPRAWRRVRACLRRRRCWHTSQFTQLDRARSTKTTVRRAPAADGSATLMPKITPMPYPLPEPEL
jgi:hypothetical protein